MDNIEHDSFDKRRDYQAAQRRLMRNIFHIKVEKGLYEITGETIYNRSVLVIRKLYLNT